MNIEKYNDWLDIKRDDLFGELPYGMGSKARGVIPLINDYLQLGINGVVTSASQYSNFARILSFYCKLKNIKCNIFTPKLKDISNNLKIAKNLGANLIETKFCRSIYLNYLAKKYSQEKNIPFIEQGCSNEYLFKAFKEEANKLPKYDNIFITVGLGTSFAGVCSGVKDSLVNVIGLSITKKPEQIVKYLKKKFNFINLYEFQEKIILCPKTKLQENELFDSHYSLVAWNWLMNNSEHYKNKKNLFWNTGRKINA